MKRTMLMIASATVIAGSALAAGAIDDSSWRGGPSDAWFVNWDKALAEARKSGKAMFLLNTGSDWCGWCKKLKAEVLDKPEFTEFASENLVLVYLDSPNRDPLCNEQKAHNRLIAKALPFGGGVPHVLVVNSKGEKLGSIGGGGLGVDAYLERLRGILSEDGKKIDGDNAQTLFESGYAALAAEIAARRAALPPVTKEDFKAKVTGVAIVERSKRNGIDVDFQPPDTELDVPFGKIALFRVEYDFPEGYEAHIWTRCFFPREERQNLFYFAANPSGLYKGKGMAYGFVTLRDVGKTCTLKTVAVQTNSDPELDDFPHGWEISKTSVNLNFQEKPEDYDAKGNEQPSDTNAPSVSKTVPKGWTEDFEAAKAKAAKEKKLVLIDFSGSDWCGWCKKMDKEVFAQDKFVKEASRKFVLVMVDSPRDKSVLSALARKQNGELAKKYDVRGFPTVVIVDSDGNEVARHSGYKAGGPKNYMRYLKDLMKDAKRSKRSR